MLKLQIFRYEKNYFYRYFFLSVVEDRTANKNGERPFLRYNFSFAWSLIVMNYFTIIWYTMVISLKSYFFYHSHIILVGIQLFSDILKCVVLSVFHLLRLNSGGASSRCFVYLFPNYMYEISEFMRPQVKWKVTMERSSEKLEFAKPKKWQDSAKWKVESQVTDSV